MSFRQVTCERPKNQVSDYGVRTKPPVAGIRIGLHVANPPTLKSFINRTAREIMPGSNVSVVPNVPKISAEVEE
jgi:hypothetical protein